MPIVQDGGQSCLQTGGAHGVLLIHGFTGSPSEMSLLADYLYKHNYTTYAVRLPGHSTTVEDLMNVKYRDWLSAVEDAYHLLDALCDQVSVVGMSMGGLLAMHLANSFDVHKLVSLATPIYIQDKRLPFLQFYGLFQSYVTKRQRVYDVDVHIHYDKMPIKSIAELIKLMDHVKPILADIKAPCLVMQSKVEHTLKSDSAEYIYANISSVHKKLAWKYHSGHLLVLDKERNEVFEDIRIFLEGDVDV